ncbi:putative phosphatidylethanolamine-binding protein [Arabidopsis thaliana]
MAASVDPLVVGRVIGDVLDMFIPTANMSVYFGPKHITNGCEIKPSTAVNPPKVNISGHSDELYTLVYSSSHIYIHLCIYKHICVYMHIPYMLPRHHDLPSSL